MFLPDSHDGGGALGLGQHLHNPHQLPPPILPHQLLLAILLGDDWSKTTGQDDVDVVWLVSLSGPIKNNVFVN